MAAPDIQIVGLREVRRALRQVDEELPRELSRELKQRVAVPVATLIAARVPLGPGRKGHWRSEIRAGGNARGAYITWGRSAHRWRGWVEFGGDRVHSGAIKGTQRFAEITPTGLRRGRRVVIGTARGQRRAIIGDTSGAVISRRPYLPEGRYVYPTVKRAEPLARRAAERVIKDLARKAGLD